MNQPGFLSKYVEAGMSEVRRSFLSLSGTVGLVCAALPPALMFTFALVHAMEPNVGATKAWAVGIALGVALESAGVKISHVALDFFKQWRDGDNEAQPLFLLSTLLTVFYLASGAIAIYHFDENPTIRLAGYLSYLVAAIMYVSSGLELLRDSRINGIVAKLQSLVEDLQGKVNEWRDRAADWQAKAEQWQSKAKDWQSRAEAAQEKASNWQSEVNNWKATAEQAQRELRAAQSQLSEWKDIVEAWQHMNERYQLVAKANAGLVDKDEVMAKLDLSRRTVETDMKKLNGVAK